VAFFGVKIIIHLLSEIAYVCQNTVDTVTTYILLGFGDGGRERKLCNHECSW